MYMRWDIINENIVCHIVGMNNVIKEKFIEEMTNQNVIVRDIDQLTHNIRNTSYFVELYKQAYREKNIKKKDIRYKLKI